MTWPASNVNTTNVDASTDSPAVARTDILDLFTKFNLLIGHVSSFMQTLLTCSTAALARTDLGAAASGANADITSLTSVTSIAGVTSINGGYVAANRNLLDNGDMRLSVRNGATAITPTATAYTVDRFAAGISQGSKLTFQQVVDAPPGFKYSLKATVASQYAPAATDQFILGQGIEGNNTIQLGFGTASPSSVTVSLWVKGSVPGTYSCSLSNSAGTRTYIGTVTVTTSWARQSIVFTGDTTGTWLTDNGCGLWFDIDLGCGTNYNGTAGTWTPGAVALGRRTSGSVIFVNQTAGATLQWTGVQLEAGTTPTVFETRNIGYESSRCQRYCQSVSYQWIQAGIAGNGFGGISLFPVDMRATPNIFSNTNLGTTNITGPGIAVSPFGITPQGIATASNISCVYVGTMIVSADF